MTCFAFLAGKPAVAAVVGLLVQMGIVAVLMQQMLPLYAMLVSPVYASVAHGWGPRAAMLAIVSGNVILVHLVSVLLTIPAVMGVKCCKIQVNKAATAARVLKDVPLVALNGVISIVFGYVTLASSTPDAMLLDITAGLPDRSVVAVQSAMFLIATEVWFYHVHRLFHENKYLYAKVHKIHHTWPAPVSIVSTYAHPIEHIGVNLASISFGPALVGAHPVLTLVFTLLFGIGAAAHHSGYWSEDMGMHDLHHQYFTVNYGNAHLLDILYGTYRCKGSCDVTPKKDALKLTSTKDSDASSSESNIDAANKPEATTARKRASTPEPRKVTKA